MACVTNKIYHHIFFTSETYHCRIRYQENLSQSYLLPTELTTVVFVTSKRYPHRILPMKLIVVLVTVTLFTVPFLPIKHQFVFLAMKFVTFVLVTSITYQRRTCTGC